MCCSVLAVFKAGSCSLGILWENYFMPLTYCFFKYPLTFSADSDWKMPILQHISLFWIKHMVFLSSTKILSLLYKIHFKMYWICYIVYLIFSILKRCTKIWKVIALVFVTTFLWHCDKFHFCKITSLISSGSSVLGNKLSPLVC